jgi:hypothetical protein
MFRIVVIVAAAMGLVIAVAAIFSPLAGAIVLAAEAAFAVALLARGSRGAEPRTQDVAETADDGVHRVLVIANETVGGAALLSEIQSRTGDRKSEILVITPALAGSKLDHWASDIDEGIKTARQRLDKSVQTLSSLGLEVRGEVGDHDPNTALSDALRAYAADEVIIATHTPERSRWLEQGVVDKAREEVPIPVTHVVVDLEGEKTTN